MSRRAAAGTGRSPSPRWGLPVRRVEADEASPPQPDTWPATVPAVAQLLRDGLDLGPATVLVGENGTGKSTVTEALAAAFGLSPEGGSVSVRGRDGVTEEKLSRSLRLVRGVGSAPWGFFLRAEAMHGLFTYLDGLPGAPPSLNDLSHGESFLEVLRTRFDSPGFYVLDEPESALSFSACLGLVGLLHDLVADGRSQVVVATHSPVVAALPGARILEFDEDGWQERQWEELELVKHYRHFVQEPMRYLRHIL